MKLSSLIVLAFLHHFLLAQELCGPVDFCSGLSARSVSGACQEKFYICEDGDNTTDSFCDKSRFQCSHTIKDPSSPVCYTECIPQCNGKECGEDGCGSFCGTCGEGQGCSDYICVSGSGSSGTCDSPYFLGNATELPIIMTDTRLTIVTTGNTTHSINVETPSCNTLTASPELIYQFVVPAGYTYGYDFQLSGYDTVIQLMKVRTHLLQCMIFSLSCDLLQRSLYCHGGLRMYAVALAFLATNLRPTLSTATTMALRPGTSDRTFGVR
jgi:hypothetical protein